MAGHNAPPKTYFSLVDATGAELARGRRLVCKFVQGFLESLPDHPEGTEYRLVPIAPPQAEGD